jgi:Ca-activated chloride channel family protein
VVLFGNEAQRIQVKDLPYVSVGPYHTNTQEGLRVAREILLQRKSQNRSIIMITDGKPTVIRKRNGEIYKNSFGLDPYITNRTLDEALICRKKNIVITTFMVTSDPYLQSFINKLTELNRGRAYFTPLNKLGGFIFRDFMSNRSKRVK